MASAAHHLPAQPLFADWREVIEQARPGDLILSDPPYVNSFDGLRRRPLLPRRAAPLTLALRRCSLERLRRRHVNSADAHPLYRGWAKLKPVFR